MYYYVYQITNLCNNKIYVGVHKTFNMDDGYMGSGRIIQRAIQKYGSENFRKDILKMFDTYEDALAYEKVIVTDEFLLREDVYNLRRGGTGGFDYINKNGLNANTVDPKFGERNSFYGKKHSQDTKDFLSAKAHAQWKGVPKSEDHKQKIREALTGVPLSDERKKKISEANKGREAHNKGIPAERWVCPHCGKEGGGLSNKTRYHFDNCKEKK